MTDEFDTIEFTASLRKDVELWDIQSIVNKMRELKKDAVPYTECAKCGRRTPKAGLVHLLCPKCAGRYVSKLEQMVQNGQD